MKVECTVDEAQVADMNGRMRKGVVVTCNECGHATESCGTGDASVKRCLAMMSEECPEGLDNFYVPEDE